MTVRVVVVGAGPIGVGVAREIVARPSLQLVSVVDVDPAKACTRVEGVAVTAALPAAGEAEVAVLTTTSSFAKLEPLALEVIKRGMHVVSTCEQLAWPWQLPEVAVRVDEAARAAKVAVLGTGVNPGYLMDTLPLALTAPCRRVDKVRVERVQDASLRRRPFQDKVGVGMAPADVERALLAKSTGHVGLEESARMIAARLEFGIDTFEERAHVVVAADAIERAGRRVEAGQVLGVEQVGVAKAAGVVKIELFFRATFAQGELHPGTVRDRVVVEGEPALDVIINGGVPGDIATCAIVANAIPSVIMARPGLRTMADVPLVAWSR